MKRFAKWFVIPALALTVSSEANAQRFGGGGLSIGVPGFGYSTGMGRGSGFGLGTPGLGYGSSFGYGNAGWNNPWNRGLGFGNPYGFNQGLAINLGGNSGFNRGSGFNDGYGYYNPYGYNRGTTINLGGMNRYDNDYRYGSSYSQPTYSMGSMPVTSSSMYQPTYSTSSYGAYQQPTYSTNAHGSYSQPSYSTSGISQMSYSMPSYSTSGVVQMGYTEPSYSTGSGIVQASAWSTPAAAKVKLTVLNECEVWADGKQLEGTGTTRELTTDTLSSYSQVKLKIKHGESTREFTMPVRPGEDSRVDLTPLLR